jgi:general secretion pathway protein K
MRSMNKAVGDSSSGFVLIAVLWIIAALTALASVYALYVNATATGLNAYDRDLKAEGAARAAVEFAAFRILASSDQLRPHSGEFELVLGDTTVRAQFASENCRVDLNSAPKELLEALFLASGAAGEAASYAAEIVAARSGAAGDVVRNIAPKLPRKLRAAGELIRLAQVPPDVVEKALPLSTVYTGNGKLDIFCASPQLLSYLPGFERDRAGDLLAALGAQVADARTLSSILGPAQSFVTFDLPKVYRIRISSAFKNHMSNYSEVVIMVYKEAAEPYSVLSWSEAAF